MTMMKTGFRRAFVAVLDVALIVTMFPLTAFAAEGGAKAAERTILLYDCGADLETDAGLATYNLKQILESRFSADDDIRFLVMIADVSGKGVPAALFMMMSKIILDNRIMDSSSPAQILQQGNEMILRNNSEGMFVTVWVGILEISQTDP